MSATRILSMSAHPMLCKRPLRRRASSEPQAMNRTSPKHIITEHMTINYKIKNIILNREHTSVRFLRKSLLNQHVAVTLRGVKITL